MFARGIARGGVAVEQRGVQNQVMQEVEPVVWHPGAVCNQWTVRASRLKRPRCDVA